MWQIRSSIHVCKFSFINILQAAFMSTDPKSGKKDHDVKQLFTLLGSAGIKAAHKHVYEIDP